ncbi:BTAD domain-containing putative transcriptional regulator [Streptomyces albulus]|nr:BTAD domain-containing putative transcriptional regulator [Streptomyces noursei]
MAQTSVLPGSDRIRLLGPVRYVSGRGDVTRPGAPGPQTVLAALALHPGTLVTVDELIDGLYFDDPPASARRVIVNYIHRLRTHLDREAHGEPPGDGSGRAVIETMADGYVLRMPEDRVDALDFGRLVGLAWRHADGGDPAAGPPFGGGARDVAGPGAGGLPGPFALDWRRTLGEQLASALEYRLELLLACGRHAEAVPDIVRALKTYPYRERLHGALMVALYRSGRAAEALSAYDRARRVLAEDLGIDTGPTLRALHAAILAGDHALLLPPEQGEEDAGAPSGPPGARARGAAAGPTSAGALRFHRAPGADVGAGGRVDRGPAARRGRRDRHGRGREDRAGPAGGARGRRNLPGRPVVREPAGARRRARRAGRGPRGVPDRTGVPAERIPGSLAERAALFRTLLSPRAVLVVLDNATTTAQVDPLLPGAARCAVLVTGRSLTALPAAVTVPLRGLGADEAVELIGRVAGIHRIQEEPDAVTALVTACGRLPPRAAGGRGAAGGPPRVERRRAGGAGLGPGAVARGAAGGRGDGGGGVRDVVRAALRPARRGVPGPVGAALHRVRRAGRGGGPAGAGAGGGGRPGGVGGCRAAGDRGAGSVPLPRSGRGVRPAEGPCRVARVRAPGGAARAIDFLCAGVVAAVQATQPLSDPLTAEIHRGEPRTSRCRAGRRRCSGSGGCCPCSPPWWNRSRRATTPTRSRWPWTC